MITRHLLLALALLAGCSMTPEERRELGYRLQVAGAGVSQVQRGLEPEPIQRESMGQIVCGPKLPNGSQSCSTY